jgi:hypothetical protein
MRKSTLFVGLDEAKDTIAVAVAEPDRRDAATLARLHRAGELTAVWVPDTESEAMRDLTRSREDTKYAETRARQRLGAFFLRRGRRPSWGSTGPLSTSGSRRWGWAGSEGATPRARCPA